MSSKENQAAENAATASEEDAQVRALIDRSARFPVLFFFTSAAVWLVLSAILGFLASLKLTLPEFMDFETRIVLQTWVVDWGAILSYGRVYPALMNSLIYGWGFQAAFGAGIWIMARLCRCPLKNPLPLVVAGHFWNLGVVVGVFGILLGQGTAILWLEFPAFVWPMLFVSYILITIWMLVMFRTRRAGDVYISQWYLLAAFLLFPWIYLTANVLIHLFGGSAVMAAAISAWYSSTLVYLWFAPVGLAAAYYLIPKILGRPIHSYQLAIVGFWSLIIIGGWTGIQRFMGGPLPAWMPTVSSEATVLLLLPALAVGVNLYLSIRDGMGHLKYSPTLRFTFFGSVSFTAMVFLGALLSFFGVGRYLQFTLALEGYDMLVLYGFFSMTMFGAFYFIAPRITRCEWLSGRMIGFHYWLSAYGVLTLVAGMLVGGIAQGADLAAWDKPIQYAVEKVDLYIVAQCLGWVMILLSNLMFLFHVLLMALRFGRRTAEGPTLLAEPAPEGEGLKTGGAHA